MWDIVPVVDMTPILEYETKVPKSRALKSGERLTPLSDVIFKLAFQNEEYKKYTCKLISCLTGLEYDYLLENMAFYKNTINKERLEEVQRMGDLVVKIKDAYYLVEMNNYCTLGRNIKNSMLVSAINTEDKRNVKFFPLVEIGLNNYRLKGIDRSINVYATKNILPDRDNELLIKAFYIEVYLPIIEEKGYNELNETERVLKALFTPSKKDGEELSKGDAILMDYNEMLEDAKRIDEILGSYDKAQEEREVLFELGEKKGVQKNQRDIIVNMIGEGFELETIARCLKVDVSEIEKIMSKK
ncbi:MAG TPA: hypothetical protein DCY94_04380 [Firmicutes bacterium]|nr:hypothetical protein [Bacillota bacterium]